MDVHTSRAFLDLPDLERAHKLNQLKDENSWDNAQLARHLGMMPTAVGPLLAPLKLSPNVQSLMSGSHSMRLHYDAAMLLLPFDHKVQDRVVNDGLPLMGGIGDQKNFIRGCLKKLTAKGVVAPTEAATEPTEEDAAVTTPAPEPEKKRRVPGDKRIVEAVRAARERARLKTIAEAEAADRELEAAEKKTAPAVKPVVPTTKPKSLGGSIGIGVLGTSRPSRLPGFDPEQTRSPGLRLNRLDGKI